MRKALFFLPLIVAFGLGVLFWQSLGKDPSTLPSALINKPLPDFSLPTVESSSELISAARLKGQPVLLNIWATWCPSCHMEHPYFMQLAKQGVPIIGINYKDDRASAMKWLAELGNPYLFSIFDEKGSLGFDLGVYGAPETYLIDKDGIIRYKHVGVVDERVWREQIQPIYERLKS
ncbi:DsbE family thiol:disulfide interchange protein [Pokkaliibacter plantistimulans]|uniref:DsbE family thiol:disulfide interchange protein n=1 Tax=Proteobacteria bacterium 228 TaxID=2083153 RepID=A0A2S5KUE5_9PROT|nr:DsbE family thiol:disulfide interchange protein [Pokkaliibacter plantistimulans]PPC78380.1 DsbE family thiol:disulfide interchange protein [Pokkaliibacter plantistimulans]